MTTTQRSYTRSSVRAPRAAAPSRYTFPVLDADGRMKWAMYNPKDKSHTFVDQVEGMIVPTTQTHDGNRIAVLQLTFNTIDFDVYVGTKITADLRILPIEGVNMRKLIEDTIQNRPTWIKLKAGTKAQHGVIVHVIVLSFGALICAACGSITAIEQMDRYETDEDGYAITQICPDCRG